MNYFSRIENCPIIKGFFFLTIQISMEFIPNSPVPAVLWRKETVDLFAFYNIPILCMRFTCQLCVKRHKYSKAVYKGM